MGTVHVLSESSQRFEDRTEAGIRLGRELAKIAGRPAVVLGIPRGGLVVACEAARAIQAELDVVIVRKVGAPGNPELAIGAVAEGGGSFLNESIAATIGASGRYVEQAQAQARQEVARRAETYRQVRPRAALEGKIAIVVDDGVATGATVQVALWAVRQESPTKLILALPVAPSDTLSRLGADADQTLCLQCPPMFQAVGQFYRIFDQTPDETVMRILREQSAGPAPDG